MKKRYFGDFEKGFTLIELMTVVVVVGVLALIASFSYRKLNRSAKVTEATNVVGAIKIAQEAVRSEYGRYISSSASIAAGNNNWSECYPKSGTAADYNGSKKYAWGGFETSKDATWKTLDVQTSGGVTFCYTSVAGTTGSVPTTIAFPGVTWPGTATAPWFVVAAQADLDGDTSSVTSVGTSSWHSGVFTHNEGL